MSENTLSCSVKHPLAISQLLKTRTLFEPILMVKAGPYLSAMAPSVLWSSFLPPKRCRWPRIGRAPPACGALQVLVSLVTDVPSEDADQQGKYVSDHG